MQIVSWNVAGIRACFKKGLADFMKDSKSDVFCFQEVKASEEQIPEMLKSIGYYSYHSIAEKKGYSGVSTFTKAKPISVRKMGIEEFDNEGRVIALEFENFFLINTYFPNSSRDLTRLEFKIRFNKEFHQFCKELEMDKPVIVAADFNVAHKDIDIRNAKENEGNAGFTLEERQWFDGFLNGGYIDTFREFTKEGDHYTWWSQMPGVRQRNIGWRIDYFVISNSLKNNLKSSKILPSVMGSDHCPITMEIT